MERQDTGRTAKGESSGIPRISLVCLVGEECPVYIEPYGHELTLMAGERFYVESWAIGAGTFEVGYVADGIWLGFDPLDAWVITDTQGAELLRMDPSPFAS